MNSFISQRMKNMPPSKTLALAALAKEMQLAGHDVVSMTAGESSFETAPEATSAAIEALRRGETRYTAAGGTDEIKRAIAAKFLRDNALHYDCDQIIVSNGAKQSIFNAMAVTVNPGDEVIIPSPYWVSYPPIVSMNGGVSVFVECDEADGFRLSAQRLEQAITERTKWLFLNYPNNPSGALMDRDRLHQIADVLRRHENVHVLSDDIYETVVFDGEEFVTLAQVAPDLAGRVLTVNGVSKSHAMTGWRIGFAAGHPDLVSAMTKLQSHSTSNPSSISQAAAIGALENPGQLGSWADQYADNRDMLLSGLDAIEGISVNKPRGSFYAFPNVEGLLGSTTPSGKVLKTGDDVCDFWLDEAQVLVVPGSSFGYANNLRMTFSIEPAKIELGMTRIQEACSRLIKD